MVWEPLTKQPVIIYIIPKNYLELSFSTGNGVLTSSDVTEKHSINVS